MKHPCQKIKKKPDLKSKMFFSIFIMLWCSCCYIAIWKHTHTKLFCRGFCHYVSHGCPQLTSIEFSTTPTTVQFQGGLYTESLFLGLGFKYFFFQMMHKSLFLSGRDIWGVLRAKRAQSLDRHKSPLCRCVLV